MKHRHLSFGKTLLFSTAVFLLPSTSHAYHAWSDNTRCLDCHTTLPLSAGQKTSFHTAIATICAPCHTDIHGIGQGLTHPVDITPSMPLPEDMPLDGSGLMTCITCHFYHPETESRQAPYSKLLRRPINQKFCFYCHKTLS